MQTDVPAVARSIQGIRQLTKELCEGLDGLAEGVSLAAPDVVRGLVALRNEVVPLIDERLVKGAELLRRGLRDEALGYATDEPNVIEAATLLDISANPRWKVWLAGITEIKIPEPPMPRMELVASLTKAQDELVRLKPLLDVWRRMNLANAPLRDRISLLRKLRKAEPENELWFGMLEEHQQHRIPELEQAVEAATHAQDDAALAALVAEMQHDSWIHPVPSRILGRARSAMKQLRGGRVERELDSLADSLRAAHQARDLQAARTLRERWHDLAEQKGFFVVDDPRVTIALPAVDWVDAHVRMNEVAEEIRNILDSRPGGVRERRHSLRSLERLGNEMEDLAERLTGEADAEGIERAHQRIARHRELLDRDMRFRRVMMYVAIASTAVVLGFIVWHFDDQARYRRSVETAVAELQKTREAIRAGVLQELPDFQGIWEPRVSNSPEVSGLLATVRGEQSQETRRQSRLNEALDLARRCLEDLESAERQDPLAPWPGSFSEVSRTLADINKTSLAVTNQELADVARIVGALTRIGRRLMSEADAACRERIQVFDARIHEARENVAVDATRAKKILEEVVPAVMGLHRQVASPAAPEAAAEHCTLQVASEPIISLLAPQGALMQKLRALDELLKDRRDFAEAVALLDRSLGSWEEYSRQLEGIATQFSAVPEALEYGRAAENKSEWLAVDAWNLFQRQINQSEFATPDGARTLIDTYKALPPEAKSFYMGQQFEECVLPTLEHFASRDLDSLSNGVEPWLAGPWLEELMFVVKSDEKTYFCLNRPQQGASTFSYVTGNKDVEAGWPTKQIYNVEIDSVAESPQAMLATRIRSRIREWGRQGGVAVDELVLDLVELVVKSEDVDPLPRLVSARKFVLLAEEYSQPCAKTFRRLAEILKSDQGGIAGIRTDDVWLFIQPTREENPQYVVARRKAESLLQEIASTLPNAHSEMDAERKRIETLPRYTIELVGRLKRDDAGNVIASWQRTPPPGGRVWWLLSRSGFKEAGIVDDQGVFRPQETVGPAGSPLFSVTLSTGGP